MVRKPANTRLDENSVTLYSPVFLGMVLPKHVRLRAHTTALIIQRIILNDLLQNMAEAIDPPE